MLSSLSIEAANIINEINFEGNETTEESILIREIFVAEGDVLETELLDKSRQAIMDLGLFKNVSYYLREVITANDAELSARVDVVFVVEEKLYLLVLPRIRTNEDETHYGIQVRWDNVWGLNHEMRLLLEDRGSTQGVDEQRESIEYTYPNVNGTPFNIEFEIQAINSVDELIESETFVDRQDNEFRLSLSRWLNNLGRNRGWLLGGELKFQQRLNEVFYGEGVSEKLDALILGFTLSYNSVNNYEYNRGGKLYSYNFQISDERLGSDSEYTRHLFIYRSYYRIDGSPLSNLNVQTRLGHSNNLVLDKTAFSLGSSSDLRGYEKSRFTGNTMLLTNVEYMFPHPDYPVVRYVCFMDLGNTYDQFEDILHKPLNVGVGFGVRWKIPALVRVDLRVDIGYGVTDEDYRVSFGTRHAF